MAPNFATVSVPVKARAPWLAAIVLVVAIVVALAGWWLTRAEIEAAARERFDLQVRDVHQAVADRLRDYEQILRGGAGLFNAAGSVSRGMWRRYYDTLRIEQAYPGIQGFGFALRVPAEAMTQHVAVMRGEGFSDYKVTPAGERPEATPIVFIEPFADRNLRAFGYDMFAEPVRRLAMERARDLAEPAISGKVVLVQESGDDRPAGFLMYIPVYAGGLIPEGTEERRRALFGFAYGPFRARDFIDGLIGERGRGVELQLYDGAPAAGNLLAASAADSGRQPRFRATRRLDLYGRPWTLRFASTAVFEASISQALPLTVLVAGLAIGALLAALTWLLALAGAKAAQLAANEAALERARAEAEAANDAKTRFLAAASHDLRQPLQAANLFIHLLKGKTGAGVVAELVDQLAASLAAAERMLTSLMDLAALESGALVPKLQSVPLRDFLLQIAQETRPEAERCGLKLLSRSVAVNIVTDPVLLERMVRNLVQNALRYTQCGGFLLAARRRGGGVAIQVWDTGGGIPPERVDHIFREFYQTGGAPRERGQRGLGMGLATVARLANLLGYRVTVSSRVGRGTVFTIVIPALAPSP